MDGRTLQDIMQSPNWTMWGPATDAFNTTNDQAKATLADTLQTTQQNAQMHPLKMDTERAQAGNLLATARNTNATAATNEDSLKVLQSVPMDQRVAAKMGEMIKQVAEGDKARVGADMLKAAKYATTALSQGGQLSAPQMLELSKESPGLLNYFKQPNGAKVVANMVTAFNALDADRQKSDSSARISAGATIESARLHTTSAEKINKDNIEAGKYANHTISFKLQSALASGNFEQASVAAAQLSRDLAKQGDMEGAKQYADASNDYYTKAITAKQAAAAEANKAKPDLNPMGIPTVTPIGSPGAPAPSQPPASQPQVALPPEAIRSLNEGQLTTFRNGQVWTLQQGKAVRIK